ncbi:MAG: lysophospholipid acyltransferase family protein [Proteobacteria bacterium]|nr:lysophospholipid acyltransferase family protein [Pseudomonadota bacterium]
MSKIRAALCLSGMIFCLLLIIPVQPIMLLLGGRVAEPVPNWFFKAACRLMGIRIDVRGRPADATPVLYVANHISWLDIFVLGGVLTSSFVARADLAGWGVFGWLSKLRQTIFIDREHRSHSGAHLEQMNERLEAGDSLILFPEGTSSDGGRVLPFKSSLFAVAERWTGDHPLTVQSISIAYTRMNNMPLGRHVRPYVGWFGDMELSPHLWELLTMGRVTAVVTFHEPVTLETLKSRKAMCAHCYGEIVDMVQHLNAGYDPTEEAV